MQDWKPDLVFSAGDLIGGQKSGQSAAQLDAMWAAFEREVREPLQRAGLPFAFALGNHDASAAPGFAPDRDAARRYWQAHRPALNYADAGQFPFWYSHILRACPHTGGTAGGTPGKTGCQTVFVAVVDATTDTLQSERWLQAQLASPAARSARMRIVMGHLPLYGLSVGRSKAGEVLRSGERLRGLLEQWKVNLYISGHHAAYYLGRRGHLALLASGGIGARDYVGRPGSARSVVSVLDLDLTSGEARSAPFDADTGQPMAPAGLPARIDGYGGQIERLDLLRF